MIGAALSGVAWRVLLSLAAVSVRVSTGVAVVDGLSRLVWRAAVVGEPGRVSQVRSVRLCTRLNAAMSSDAQGQLSATRR